jgi:putative copper resistance protein D
LNALFDIFGLLSVILHGLDLVAQTVLLGSVSFALLVDTGVSGGSQRGVRAVSDGIRRIVLTAAVAMVITTTVTTALSAVALATSLGASWHEVAGAGFVIYGIVKALAAASIGLMVWTPFPESTAAHLAIGAMAALVLYAAVANSHAVARFTRSGWLMVATAAHALGAALWLGGLPCFWLALRRAGSLQIASRIAQRFSVLAIAGVALIIGGALVFTAMYIGSIDALYGTAYGAMAFAKSILFGMLLLLGFANFRAARRVVTGGAAARRIQRFVEVEMGIGFAVLMAAASITSLPPAVDLVEDRLTKADVAVRMTPALPRLSSPDHASLALPALQARLDQQWQEGQESTRMRAFTPGSGALPPRNAFDIAWSEYNHHWAGLLVVVIGLAAFAQRGGRARWAKHWPLLFLFLAAFLFLRADPEVWPMGDIGFIESLKDPEVAQHRLFVVLIAAFAFFEWGVRTEKIATRRLQLVFPLVAAFGGTLLLTHSHSLGNVKEELLIEFTHLPIAVLGITAGWARWLEVEAPDAEGRWAGRLWPVCFVLIGLLLLGYREA